jgi:manganese-dependent ADP-ribose/CDP-alcohol diphosphatase
MNMFFVSILATIILCIMPEKNNPGTIQPDIQNQPLFTFGILADIQYCDSDPAGTRFYRSSPEKLREAIDTFREEQIDFLINLGDLIDKDFRSYKPVLDIIDSSGIKTFHVAGNHDYSVEARFKKRLPVIQSADGYYSFIHENFRLVFLNGNEISTYISNNKASIKQAEENLTVMRKNGEINAVEWNGGFSTKQIVWLKNQLDEAADKNEKVLLLCHFPLVPDNVHNLLNYKEVLQILQNYRNIVAWFNGHNHAGDYGTFNKIHFVTFKGMVETDTSNSFAIIDVYNNKLLIRGYGREKDRILQY